MAAHVPVVVHTPAVPANPASPIHVDAANDEAAAMAIQAAAADEAAAAALELERAAAVEAKGADDEEEAMANEEITAVDGDDVCGFRPFPTEAVPGGEIGPPPLAVLVALRRASRPRRLPALALGLAASGG